MYDLSRSLNCSLPLADPQVYAHVSRFEGLCLGKRSSGRSGQPGVVGGEGTASTTHPHPRSCTDSPVVKDPISDAGGPRFESHAGRVTGKPTPSLWRDEHPAIKGLRPPEHHPGQFCQDQKGSSESNPTKASFCLWVPFRDHPLNLERRSED